MITKVVIGKNALKQLEFLPRFIGDKLRGWIETVQEQGLAEVRKNPGLRTN